MNKKEPSALEPLPSYLSRIASEYVIAALDAARVANPGAPESALKKQAAESIGVSVATLYRYLEGTPGAPAMQGKV